MDSPALWLLAAGLALGSRADPPAGTPEIDFGRDVRPILAERCFGCHGPERQKALLRLDRREAAFAGAWGDELAGIVPGGAAESPLWLHLADRVEGEDRMPPEGEPLSDEELALLAHWIDGGASWPADGEPGGSRTTGHRACRAPVRAPLPELEDPARCRDISVAPRPSVTAIRKGLGLADGGGGLPGR